jgi:hypothetical protein
MNESRKRVGKGRRVAARIPRAYQPEFLSIAQSSFAEMIKPKPMCQKQKGEKGNKPDPALHKRTV